MKLEASNGKKSLRLDAALAKARQTARVNRRLVLAVQRTKLPVKHRPIQMSDYYPARNRNQNHPFP